MRYIRLLMKKTRINKDIEEGELHRLSSLVRFKPYNPQMCNPESWIQGFSSQRTQVPQRRGQTTGLED